VGHPDATVVGVGNPAEENDRMPDNPTLAKPALHPQAIFYTDLHGATPRGKAEVTMSLLSMTKLSSSFH
jgi:hypothetical protein